MRNANFVFLPLLDVAAVFFPCLTHAFLLDVQILQKSWKLKQGQQRAQETVFLQLLCTIGRTRPPNIYSAACLAAVHQLISLGVLAFAL